jgi:hypothetical protein
MVSPWTGPLEYSKHYFFISLLAINIGNGSKNKAKNKNKNSGLHFQTPLSPHVLRGNIVYRFVNNNVSPMAYVYGYR